MYFHFPASVPIVTWGLLVAALLAAADAGSASENSPPAARKPQAATTCGFRVKVHVQAEDRPIGGAEIRLLEPRPDLPRRFKSDANGIALVEGVRPHGHVSDGRVFDGPVFEVRAVGYAAQTIAVAALPPGSAADLKIALAPGGRIRGTVRDAEGRPLAQARLTLVRGSSSWNSPAPRLDEVTSDAQGRYLFDNVPLGETLAIAVEHQERSLRKAVLLRPDEKRVTADMAFDKRAPMGSILVHVTGPDHRPIAGAVLTNTVYLSHTSRKGQTDANGDCRIDGVDDFNIFGRYILVTRAKGCAPDIRDFKAGPSARPNRINIELAKGHSLRARAMLTNGQPAGGARVIFDGGETAWTNGGETRTDSSGRFALDSLSPTCLLTIDGVAGYAPLCDQQVALDRSTEVTVTLDTAAVVAGRVVDDASGQPVVPFRVRVLPSPRQIGEPAPNLDVRLRDDGQVHLRPDGRFEIGDQPVGAPLRLKISAEGYVDQSVERVVARPEGLLKPLEIRLRKIDPRDLRTVSGRLLDAGGKPVVGAELRLWTSASNPAYQTRNPVTWNLIEQGWLEKSPFCLQFLSAVTDKKGEFAFLQVRAAGYGEVAYWKKGINPAREAVPLSGFSSPHVKLSLRSSATAQLVVEADPKIWPNGGLVTLFGDLPLDVPPQLIQGDRARVTFDDLPTGILTITFNGWARGNDPTDAYGSTIQHAVTLKPRETTTFRFDKLTARPDP